jgi:hypothetical protein
MQGSAAPGWVPVRSKCSSADWSMADPATHSMKDCVRSHSAASVAGSAPPAAAAAAGAGRQVAAAAGVAGPAAALGLRAARLGATAGVMGAGLLALPPTPAAPCSGSPGVDDRWRQLGCAAAAASLAAGAAAAGDALLGHLSAAGMPSRPKPAAKIRTAAGSG